VVDNGGVYLPALSGLGAPHWDMTLGELFGITGGAQQEHLVRAVLEDRLSSQRSCPLINLDSGSDTLLC